MSKARIFRQGEIAFGPTVTPTGTTSIARLINPGNSRSLGAGIEYIEATTIDWTVTYDEVLFLFEGELTVELDGIRHDCTVGDVIWLPEGTQLRYIATGRAGYFYALWPVDWATQQGRQEP